MTKLECLAVAARVLAISFALLLTLSVGAALSQATVYIECTGPDGKVTRGSGVIVGERGEVMTARHLVPPHYTCKGLVGTVADMPTRKLLRRKMSATWDAALMFFVPQQGETFAPVTYVPIREDFRSKQIEAHGFPEVGTGELSSRSGTIATTIPDEDGTIETDSLTTKGMSGGPVFLKGSGHLVGIVAGAQFDKTTAVPTHYKVLAADLVASEFELIAADLGSGAESGPQPTKADAIFVSGTARAEVFGTGGGGLAQRIKADAGLGETAEVNGRGGEFSECDDDSGRTVSEASASGRVDVVDGTGLKFSYNVRAQGGHFRTAGACFGSTLVGITGHDTGSSSLVRLLGTIEFTQQKSAPLELEWEALPPGARLSISDPALMTNVRELKFEGSGTKSLSSLEAGKRYILTVELDGNADSVGSCCPQLLAANSFVRIKGGVFDQHSWSVPE
ncbi:serine protease [Sinorhizobium meliloti]|uniref:S1 family peptidase n=1 Tax=Rhizobium meliloti TaxID=382 RepID=UPI00299DE634|nr:hypothetical protein [Sinorhizobium meliloti]